MEELAKIFRAIGDTNRMRIIKMLEQRPMCVCEITDILALAGSTVSKHLSILRDAGFIEANKQGRWVDYRIKENADCLQIRQLISLFPMWLNNESVIMTDVETVKNSVSKSICEVN